MVYKLAREAERHRRRLSGHKLIGKIFKGIKFRDGIEQPAEAA
jgi:hypothetical protein